jgi:hypothetical protein
LDTGDVCCICLGTMSYLPIHSTKSSRQQHDADRGNNDKSQSTKQQCNVKKVSCGHLYHTSCLREVIERARSIEAARCPLCRAPFVPTKQQDPSRRTTTTTTTLTTRNTNRNNNVAEAQRSVDLMNNLSHQQEVESDDNTTTARRNTGDTTNMAVAAVAAQNPAVEDSIFRFSTEGLLPDWIPVPGFSFEIVRRPSLAPVPVAVNDNIANVDDALPQQHDGQPAAVPNQQQQQQPMEQSLLRRILLLSGIVQMSPAEEAIALEQLLDMFPQYERLDLQRALRQRGTIEAVVESILAGVFVGIPRGG